MAWSQVKAIGIGKVIAALLSALTVGVSSFIRVPQIRKLLINSLNTIELLLPMVYH